MKSYKVPLAPMLGCVGVAPQGGMRYRSGVLGSYGGNMDYNQLREGTTVYLPVYVPGALLFMGDGHGQPKPRQPPSKYQLTLAPRQPRAEEQEGRKL